MGVKINRNLSIHAADVKTGIPYSTSLYSDHWSLKKFIYTSLCFTAKGLGSYLEAGAENTVPEGDGIL